MNNMIPISYIVHQIEVIRSRMDAITGDVRYDRQFIRLQAMADALECLLIAWEGQNDKRI